MEPTPLDLSQTELTTQVQENMIAYMRLFAGLPGMYMRDDDAFWFVSGKPAPGDYVLRACWQEERSEERIDELFSQIGQQIDRVDWMVFPGDQPADLSRRLESRGMLGGPGGNWLWADLASLALDNPKSGPAAPPNFHIQQVSDDRMMAEWVRVSEAGFGVNLPSYFDAYARHGYGPGALSIHYTGYLDGTPVTSATLLDAGGCASIYDVSTSPAFRRQGFGAAITRALMREIRERGYAGTWIWSSNVAKSVYQQLGYVDASFGVREHTWRRP